MKIRSKIIYILFYCLALLCLIITGSVKIKHVNNFWSEFIKLLKKKVNIEDGDYIMKDKHAR